MSFWNPESNYGVAAVLLVIAVPFCLSILTPQLHPMMEGHIQGLSLVGWITRFALAALALMWALRFDAGREVPSDD